MEMKNRLLFVPVLLALVVSLAACGGGSASIPAGAIAVVNGTPITLAQYNQFFQQAVNAAKAQHVTVSPGSEEYTTLRNQTVAELVDIAEAKQQMKKEGLSVTQSDVDKFLANLVKTNYNGKQAKLLAVLKQQHMTMAAARQQVYINLLATKLRDKVIASAKVTPAQEQAYYKANLAQYTVAAATTRNVAHILVKTKSQADMIEQKLKNGASFAALAKKYSTDTGSAQNGGKLCIAKSGQSGSCIQTVAPFAKVAFALKTGQISAPVHSQYGWHVIEAVGPVKNQNAHTQTFAEAKSVIASTLLTQAQGTLWQQWVTDLAKQYKGKISYQSGYAPPATTAVSTGDVATTG
jgi:foldase protein PrsA